MALPCGVMIRLLLALVLTAAPLDVAQGHLKAGQLDDVLFALDGQRFEGEDKPRAAALLGEAARAAVTKKDELLALQFAQMALKLDPRQPYALEAAARTAASQQQFEAAERYCETWIEAEPTNPQARLLRAQLAVDNADWQVALDTLDAGKFTGPDAKRAAQLRSKASKELLERKSSQSAIAVLERQIAEAARTRRAEPSSARPRAPSTDIVLYSTTWCGYCKKARNYLTAKKVFFTEKDVEKDPEASKELAQKAAAAGVRPQGVPVIDVRGTLILGFDQAALERAL